AFRSDGKEVWPVGPYLKLRFFDVSTLKHCTLHILNLGLCAVANGGCLLMLLKMGVFGPMTDDDDIKAPLSTAFDDFTSWRQSLKIPSSQRR
ncbi:unnamed protein product, partial [Effrenium voratum]